MKRTISAGILALGVLLLLRALGWLPAAVGFYVGQYWPALLIAWGLEMAFHDMRRGKPKLFAPLLIIVTGLFLLLRNLSLPVFAAINPWLLILAVFLIYIGLSSLIGFSYVRFRVKNGVRRAFNKKWDLTFNFPGGWDPASGDDGSSGAGWSSRKPPRIPHVGEVRYGDEPWHLQPLAINNMAGSVRINLGTATIPDGETPIDVTGAFGEVRIHVPSDLPVAVEIAVSSGEVRLFEKRHSGVALPPLSYVDPGYEEAKRRVNIRIRLKFGEVRVARVV
ncbi:MAG: cell wall-active antibiotics response protein LiaF [Bacilli bacterium]